MSIFDFFKRDKDKEKDKDKEEDKEKEQDKDKEQNKEQDEDKQQEEKEQDDQDKEQDKEKGQDKEKEQVKDKEQDVVKEQDYQDKEELQGKKSEQQTSNQHSSAQKLEDKKSEELTGQEKDSGLKDSGLKEPGLKKPGVKEPDLKDSSLQEQLNKDENKSKPEKVEYQEKDEAERILQDEEDVEKGFFQRLKEGLARSRQGFVDKVSSVFSRSKIDEDFYEELEETLIQADVGVKATMDLISDLKQEVEEQEIIEPEELYQIFQEKIRNILGENDQVLKPWHDLKVLMIVGVNGSGKTTTIAKLAHRYQKQGKKVLLAAGDTFRAGAIDQIKEWGRRLDTDVISQNEGADAAAVAYDAVQAARSREADLLIVDTAGRLHTQKNLMEELKKVRRVIGREAGEEVVEVMLVVDATTGQNALNQAKIFNEAVSVDGITLTKLDGTARGGIVLAIKKELGLPIRLIGVGERAADLQDFDPDKFVEALFSSN